MTQPADSKRFGSKKEFKKNAIISASTMGSRKGRGAVFGNTYSLPCLNMDNYQKYVGTPELAAKLIRDLIDGNVSIDLEKQFCKWKCLDEEGNADCTNEEVFNCIVLWLRQEVPE